MLCEPFGNVWGTEFEDCGAWDRGGITPGNHNLRRVPTHISMADPEAGGPHTVSLGLRRPQKAFWKPLVFAENPKCFLEDFWSLGRFTGVCRSQNFMISQVPEALATLPGPLITTSSEQQDFFKTSNRHSSQTCFLRSFLLVSLGLKIGLLRCMLCAPPLSSGSPLLSCAMRLLCTTAYSG